MTRVLLLLACMMVCAAGAAVDVTNQDPFIALIKEVESQPFFQAMTESYRLLTFEILTAAETANLSPFFDRLGYIQLLKYLDLLPEDYTHQFITYSIQHLEAEGVSSNSTLGYQP